MTDKAFFGKRSCVQTDSIGIEQKLRKLMCRDKTETAQTFNTFTYFGEVVSLEKPTQTKCTHLNFRLP